MIDWNKMTPEQQSDYIAKRVKDRREIEFRAWDIREQKMYPCFGFMNGQVLIIRDGTLTGVKDDYFELMQFIGRKDKNDKKIFEGDVVSTDNEQQESWPVEEHYKGVVVYKKDHYCIQQFDDPYAPTLSNHSIVSIEVIGNIYEHPGLLGGGV